ncbi:hypothetical protein Tco_0071857 [Tanacetum coccineum]
MVQTRNPRTLVAAEVVAFGGGDDGEEMMMMALGDVGWQQWWYKWGGEAAAVMVNVRFNTLIALQEFRSREICDLDVVLVLRIILVILPEHLSDTISIHNEVGNPSNVNIT